MADIYGVNQTQGPALNMSESSALSSMYGMNPDLLLDRVGAAVAEVIFSPSSCVFSCCLLRSAAYLACFKNVMRGPCKGHAPDLYDDLLACLPVIQRCLQERHNVTGMLLFRPKCSQW